MSDDEDLVSFGTRFNFDDRKNNQPGQLVHLQNEVVTDENGKRRFHGAFTGGFSAGYYNTVGSKEGFTPSTFVSSRNVRSKATAVKPDQFMDSEDISAFGIAPRNIGTSDHYTNKTLTPHVTDSVIPGTAPLCGIVAVKHHSKGISLMRAMGWKPGFGVGSRVQKAEQKIRNVYTCQPPPGSDAQVESDEDDPYAAGLFLPPTDTGQAKLTEHTTTKGVAYQGMAAPGVWDKSGEIQKVSGMSGEAFGIGADEEKEEMSVYCNDKKSQYFSYIGEEEEEKESIHSSRNFKSQRKNYLENFVASKTGGSYVRKKYAPPNIPLGFTLIHIPQPTQDIKTAARPYNAAERAEMLGEEAIKVPQTAKTTVSSGSTYLPFSKDTEKQGRYKAYLNCGTVDYTQTLLTEWEQGREKEEFARSAIFFKPMADVISNRFTSAGTLQEEDKEDESLRDRNEAVRTKMLGKMTREIHQWCPASLLCKRFNVSNPYPDIQTVGTIRRFGSTEKTSAAGEREEKKAPILVAEEEEEKEEEEEEKEEDKTKSKEKEDEKLDLFKTIFADTDSEDESEEGEEEPALTSQNTAPHETKDVEHKSKLSDIDPNTALQTTTLSEGRKSRFSDANPSTNHSTEHRSHDSSTPITGPNSNKTVVNVETLKSEDLKVSAETAKTSILPRNQIVFNKERYGKNTEESQISQNLNVMLLEKIRSVSDTPKSKKDKKKKKKKKKKKHHYSSNSNSESERKKSKKSKKSKRSRKQSSDSPGENISKTSTKTELPDPKQNPGLSPPKGSASTTSFCKAGNKRAPSPAKTFGPKRACAADFM